jgi:hypothetical protein
MSTERLLAVAWRGLLGKCIIKVDYGRKHALGFGLLTPQAKPTSITKARNIIA